MEKYLNTLVRYKRSVQQQDADSWYDDTSEEYVPDRQTFDYPDIDYSGKSFLSFCGDKLVTRLLTHLCM